jgi:putative nucleotidyltransferase with HDIG domain
MLVSRYGTRFVMRAEIQKQTAESLTAVRPAGDSQPVAPVDGGAAPGASRSRATPYVLAMVIAGCMVLVHSLAQFLAQPTNVEWWALALLTLLSGSAVLKMPSVAVNFSISDVFTLTSAVVFGPAAGTLIVAIDSLAISARLASSGLPTERILFNAAAPPVAMWISATTFFYASGLQPLDRQPLGIEVVFPWLLLFAGLYFLLNTAAIAVAIALHERKSALAIWRAHLQSLWLAFIGGALGAGFVVFALELHTYSLVMMTVPLLVALILHFAYRHATGRVADQLGHLAQVNRLHLSTIEALAHAIDAKDEVTHGHIRRVQGWAVAVAAHIGIEDGLELRAIEAGALLHDIGKLAVPEHILNKPGKLTDAEFNRIKAHARVGAEILSEVEFPYPVVPIVRHHHENWDGTGYPDGLRGNDIPVGARILSVVDCYDALTSDRPYRRALSPEEACSIIEERQGTMYDPAIVQVFREVCTATRLPDTQKPAATADRTASGVSIPVGQPAGRETEDVAAALALGAALSRLPRDAFAAGTIAEAFKALPHVDAVAIFVVDQDRLVAAGSAGVHARALEELSMDVGERMSGWIAATGQSIVNADAALDLFDVPGCSLRSAIGVPCSRPEGLPLVVTLYSSSPNAFSPWHQRLLESAAPMIATVRDQRTITHPARLRTGAAFVTAAMSIGSHQNS